uniref:Uncharacterized protein n=1 Tax=Arundo donax TaxID=35708 RepID=A0A0A9CI87_ARUDO
MPPLPEPTQKTTKKRVAKEPNAKKAGKFTKTSNSRMCSNSHLNVTEYIVDGVISLYALVYYWVWHLSLSLHLVFITIINKVVGAIITVLILLLFLSWCGWLYFS